MDIHKSVFFFPVEKSLSLIFIMNQRASKVPSQKNGLQTYNMIRENLAIAASCMSLNTSEQRGQRTFSAILYPSEIRMSHIAMSTESPKRVGQ